MSKRTGRAKNVRVDECDECDMGCEDLQDCLKGEKLKEVNQSVICFRHFEI